MIFDKLFNQYKRGDSNLFGSLWLNIHGRLFIGNPRDNDLEHVHPELQRTYYYLKENRFSQPGDRLEFRQQGMLLSVTREAERPRMAKAAAILAMTACLAIAAIAGVKGVSDAVGSKVKGATSGFKFSGLGSGESSCVAMVGEFYQLQKAGESLPDASMEKWESCVANHRAAMDSELKRIKAGE